jgi:hypothetical protein
MPRRLSNPEWVEFQNEVNIPALDLPPWGAVVGWGSQYILVFICQGSGSLCQKGEVMLSDISDREDLIKNVPHTYDANQSVWIYHVAPELMGHLYDDAKSVLQATGQIIQTVAQQAGQAAGALTEPLLSQLTVPLLFAGVVLLWLYGPRRS